jgi:hypothetical protein
MLTYASLRRLTAACMVHQDAAHQEGGDAQKLRPSLAIRQTLVDQTEVHFIHQRGWLQGVISTLAPEVSFGDAMQLWKQQRQQAVDGSPIALPDTGQQSIDFFQRSHGKTVCIPTIALGSVLTGTVACPHPLSGLGS